ncbi:MAG TPA: hypothetical protein VMI11_09310 [Actinomycetes bacterium]|nr:hypothetical protein [Actinomycetes bacterium]
MCCFLVVLGLFGPRLAFLLTWVGTNRVTVAFHGGWFAPLLGVIFLPWTSLAYVFAYAPLGGVSGLGWLVVAGGVVLDAMTYGSGAYDRRRRAALA